MRKLLLIAFSTSVFLQKCFGLIVEKSQEFSPSKSEDLSLTNIHTINEIIASAHVPCGNYALKSGESVDFQSPNFPNKYPKNYKCTWRFTCPLARAEMGLNCDTFELEANRICFTDYLEIFNNFKSLGTFCGKNSPTGLISKSDYMKAVFHSNWDRITRAGFRCSVKCIDKQIREMKDDSDETMPPYITPSVSCGSYIMDPEDSIIIRSKNFPEFYPKNYKCSWGFTCSSLNTEMNLHCSSFALQNHRKCQTDYLEVFNSFLSIGKHCGKKGPKHLNIKSNFMKINFRSNWDRITRSGFHCIVKCKDKQERKSPKGKIEIRDKYHRNYQPVNPLLTLIQDLSTSPNLDQFNSFIETHQVNSGLKWVGLLASKIHHIQDDNNPIAECGYHLINPGDEMYFQSLNYPNNYPKDHKCVWKFKCSWENAFMEINCDHFELQANKICHTDFIEIFDNSGLLQKNCGKDTPKAVTTNTNYMKVVFKTNWDKIRRTGFFCNVMCKGITTTTTSTTTTSTTITSTTITSTKTSTSKTTALTTTTLPPTTTFITTTVIPTTTPSPPKSCGTHTIEPSTTVYFQSVKYPNNYKKDYKCFWKFTCSAVSAMMKVDCSNFLTQKNDGCTKDYLKITDNSGTLGKYCGKDGPSNVISNSNYVNIFFRTNKDKKKRTGFRCSVRCTYIETTSISTFGYEPIDIQS
ncbi:unnamed protein product, partial [Meganyctiphanes norvegica]